MERKFILLIEKGNKGKFCYQGVGTADQIRKNIKKLTIEKRIEPENLSVIPVIESKTNFKNVLIAVFGIGLTCWIAYESLYKRIRKRQRKHSST